MTVQYAKYLAVLLLTLLAFSSVKAAEERSPAFPVPAASEQTSVRVPLDRMSRGNLPEAQLQPNGGPGPITLARRESANVNESEIREDGSVAKKEADGGRDEVLELKKRILELQNKQKLEFRKVVLCSKVEGFGVYSPLPKGKLHQQMVLYFEPANVSTLLTADRYVIDCTVEIGILDSAGKPAKGKVMSRKYHRTARSPILDVYFRIPINFAKPPKKAFSLRVILHDNIKNQRTGINVRIDPKKKSQDPV